MGRRMLGLWGLGLFLASVTTASESQTETKEEVKWSAFEHVGEADFKKAMEERPYNLVAFVEPKNFESEMLEWEWPAIKEKEPNILSVDCSVETDLCLEHDVRHYPTIRTYRTGKMYARYRGPRKAESILGFSRRSTTSIVAGLTGENATSFAASDDVTFIMHLRTDDAGKGLYKRYHDLALEFRDRWSFGIVSRSDESSVDEEGEDAPTVLRCYNNAQDVQKTLDKFFDDTVGLRNFVHDCGRNLVQPLNKLNAKGYTEGDKPVLYYFDSEVPKREAFSDKIRPVAKKYADQIQVVTVDPLTFPEVVNQMMLKWQFPSMAIQVPADKRISLYDHDDIDEEIVEKFIRDILQMDQPVEYTEEVPDDEGIVMEDEEKVKAEAEGTTEEKHDEL